MSRELVDIQRGTRTTTEFLDEEDVPRTIASKIPASVTEFRPTFLPDGSGYTNEVVAVGRVGTDVDIRTFDRIVVRRTGSTYQVRAIQPVNMPLGGQRLDLFKVSGK